MTQHVLLNAVDHQQLRVKTERSAELGDGVWFTPTFPLEFRSCAAFFPVFFHKDLQSGQLMPVALFGFTHGENLFLSQDKWHEVYHPLSLRRQPFLIGLQRVVDDGVEQWVRVIHVDLAHPRISETEGEALFLPMGGQTPFLTDMAGMLETLHLGMEDNQRFVAMLDKYQLLESVTLDLKLKNGQQHQLVGFWTIAEEPLASLSAEALSELHQAGYLQAIYMMLASQSRVRSLLDLKNQQLAL